LLKKSNIPGKNSREQVIIHPQLNNEIGVRVPVLPVYDVGIKKTLNLESGESRRFRVLFLDENTASQMLDNAEAEKLREEELEKQEEIRKEKEAKLLVEQQRIEKRISGVKDMDPLCESSGD